MSDKPNTSSKTPLLPIAPELFERATAGIAEAQFQVGECFSNAFAPFTCRVCAAKISPEQMNGDACPDCGETYPFAVAARWYESAAKRNYAPAFLRLQVMYYYGLGVKKSDFHAEQFYQRAKKAFSALSLKNSPEKLRHPPVAPFVIPTIVEDKPSEPEKKPKPPFAFFGLKLWQCGLLSFLWLAFLTLILYALSRP